MQPTFRTSFLDPIHFPIFFRASFEPYEPFRCGARYAAFFSLLMHVRGCIF